MLHVSEIYTSIMGESRLSGWPCVLVRLAGCHRRCAYCDTIGAYEGGEPSTVDQVLARAEELGRGILLLTGGEPLLQRAALDLVNEALQAGWRVVLETGGTKGTAVSLSEIPAAVCKVVDVKTPGSGIDPGQVDWEGLGALTPDDEIKMVITDAQDYAWARELVSGGLTIDGATRCLPASVPVTFAPAWGWLPMRDLAEWILRDALPVRFQIQLHKILWPEAEHGV